MNQPLRTLIEQSGFEVVDQVQLPGRPPALVPLPGHLAPRLLRALRQTYPNGVYTHQAAALERLNQGDDLCLATATASGKSLVFLAHAANLLLADPKARVLAFYPARALLADQREKWTRLLEPLGLSVGLLDGGVPTTARLELVRTSRVLLVTPDVAHAWLMSNLSAEPVRQLFSALRLVVLDEAHVYEGVFGTNMAYLLRRFQAIAGPHRLVCSSATVQDPVGFIGELTGRSVSIIGEVDNGARLAEREVVALRPNHPDRFDGLVGLVKLLGSSYAGRFLVFADSRRMVELVVAGLHRDEEPREADRPSPQADAVLPYRAGYEEADRAHIQRSLKEGHLRGVVSTSAMELGLDIGEIDLVVLLGLPPTMKSFWQRLGRAGRREAGTCLLLDDSGNFLGLGGSLDEYLRRPVEPSWLYLENRYIQFTHALCMAAERKGWPGSRTPVALPPTFEQMLANELEQTEGIPPDLYALKQRAQDDPHRQFPLRSGIEPNLQVEGAFQRLGSLTWSQVLREAYPGAVYYYLGQSYRIQQIKFSQQRIVAKREGPIITHPTAQVTVFPSFDEAMALWRSDAGFACEVPMQVSERVLGFKETRGKKKQDHLYGPHSIWSRKELTRFFETTGVCWYFNDPATAAEPVGQALLEAFSLRYGVARSDLGVGLYYAKRSPHGSGPCRGLCVYDATHGSLRLTQRFAEHFSEIIATALLRAEQDEALVAGLRTLAQALSELAPAPIGGQLAARLPGQPSDANVVEVVAPGEQALWAGPYESQLVTVAAWRYTPQGLMYDLVPDASGVTQMVAAKSIQPVRGQTTILRVNLLTGQVQP